MRHPKLTKLEDEIGKIQGVTGVRIVGEAAPSEIHVVATLERPPKQIVRDVQSLSTTSLGESIDHRIVSVVQLEESPENDNAAQGRIILDQVITVSRRNDGWVRVSLRMADGQTVDGAVKVGATRIERAQGSVAAALKALQPRLDAISGRLLLQNVVVNNESYPPSVQIKADFHTPAGHSVLIGGAVIEDDIATAAARALLQALNRKLS
jgi:hypothetical protein